jgi:hypothetical protein
MVTIGGKTLSQMLTGLPWLATDKSISSDIETKNLSLVLGLLEQLPLAFSSA